MHTGHEHSCCGGHAKPAQGYATALERLRELRHRITEPRKAMLRILADYPRPISVEDLHRAIGAGVADLVTVYRSIEAFEKAGIVRRHPLESGKNLYELAMQEHHHHHVICRRCGHIDALSGCGAETFELAARKLGYTAISHVFEVYGVCKNCSVA